MRRASAAFTSRCTVPRCGGCTTICAECALEDEVRRLRRIVAKIPQEQLGRMMQAIKAEDLEEEAE